MTKGLGDCFLCDGMDVRGPNQSFLNSALLLTQNTRAQLKYQKYPYKSAQLNSRMY